MKENKYEYILKRKDEILILSIINNIWHATKWYEQLKFFIFYL